MIKLKGKILSSVLAITLLSSTGVGAAEYNFRNINYNRSYNDTYKDNSYRITYNYPVFNWQVVNTKPQVPVKPETPKEDINKPVETPQVESPSVSGLSQIELEVLRLVNIERQKEGLSPLTTSSEFSNVARKKSEDMAVKGYFSHTSPTYGSPFEMMKSFGIPYRSAGENIAKGQTSAASVMRAWMNSSGHRANIMNPSFNKIGIGMYEKNGTKYWTQMFTN